MKIYINGQETALAGERALLHYLPDSDPEKPFAIALNGEFVARESYQTIVLNDGDEIDIVRPVGGG